MEIDPRREYPSLALIFDAAVSLALVVSWGGLTKDDAEAMLHFCPAVRAVPPDYRRDIRLRLTWELRHALPRIEVERSIAYEAIQRALAPLLDRRAPDVELRQAAIAHGECLFAPRELRDIIETEKAWWVRLHAVLDDHHEPAPISRQAHPQAVSA